MVKKSHGPPEQIGDMRNRSAKNFVSLTEPDAQESISTTSVGSIMTFKEPTGSFHAFGLPRSLLLEFRLLSKPCSVVRETTLKAMNALDSAKNGTSRDSRIVLTGDSGSGKSFLLLQAVDYALQSGWIVLYIPRAISLLDSSTSYQYDPRTQTYQQPPASQQLLKRFLSVNNTTLQSMKITQSINIGRLSNFQVGTPLTQLIDAGIKEPYISCDVLSATLEQLEHQTNHPVLLAIDDFQALYCTSQYRDPDYNRIRSYHLSVPRLLLEYAGGLKSYTKGAVLGAISSTNTNFQAPLELREALQLTGKEVISPYESRSSELVQYMHGLRPFQVPAKLSVPESLGLFGIWSRHLALHTSNDIYFIITPALTSLPHLLGPNDELFHSKYTEASANARQFVRGLLGTIET
ncbi:hypothetical protein Clacol_005570 [Clathrus columnatus]|uniref:Small ribosomal subunit protein mS29 n=1 Tax=Clathrus columnatus TaxID=1419009 RepID=A0AAV5AFB2_9AGAM|nr:hypothetical protein Clacol_005570 [Clathrus columnatus]